MKPLIAVLLAVFSTGAMAEWTYLTSMYTRCNEADGERINFK